MIVTPPQVSRELKTVQFDADLVIVGGGMAGSCCAITAARSGLRVVLVQDRPLLGGNASSEVRLWVLGATCHMNANQRWAREGGVIDEILVENLYRNPEGNPLIFDTVLMEKVVEESNITLLLNTAVFEVDKDPADPDRITAVRGFCSQNSTRYELRAPLFLDSSGDGIVGFLAGAAFRMGAEKRDEFNESFAPTDAYGELLGHSIYFYSKDVGHPVKFVPPSYAIKNVPERIPRFRAFDAKTYGCRLWWIEYGGRLDTIHETETIKWELWKVVYGVWDYIKNSGAHPDSANLTLEWVGTIPGKRESRRFEGDHMLTQSDVLDRPNFDDAVAFGGWSIDLHPADGVFSERKGCNQYLPRGIYQIPYRTLYSRNVRNLFIAGRIMSSSHVAFGSTRVMGTGAHCGQAIAVAAKVCTEQHCLPRDILSGTRMREVQTRLHRLGQHIPRHVPHDPANLAEHAKATASSNFAMRAFPRGSNILDTDRVVAQMIPLRAGAIPAMTIWAAATESTSATIEFRVSERPDDYTPDVILGTVDVPVAAGDVTPIRVAADITMPHDGYLYLTVNPNPKMRLYTSPQRVSGVLRLGFRMTEKLSDLGYKDYPRFTPPRRPDGENLAITIDAKSDCFDAENVLGGFQRPTALPNAWVADVSDPAPSLKLQWPTAQSIRKVDIFFDPDYDHAVESVLFGQPERTMPFCVKHFRVRDDRGQVLAEVNDWHQALWSWTGPSSVSTSSLTIEILETNQSETPAAIFQVRAYA